MSGPVPIVYLLIGEDEFAISQTLADLQARLEDPTTAAMNTTRLEGSSFNPEQLLSIAGVMPFLARRRLVILVNPLARLGHKPIQQKFLSHLEQLPPTTALVIVENRNLTSEKDRRDGKIHWLEAWAAAQNERAWIKFHSLPKGAEWSQRIQAIARKAGGQFTPAAAEMLAGLVDGDLRLAAQETQKLLAYVNYSRPVDVDDVQMLTADVGQGDIFAMVDALGSRDGRKALGMLQRLLDYQDYFSIFGMVVRQFRMLLLARGIMDRGGGKDEIVHGLKLYGNSWLADRLMLQARRFTLSDIRAIYRRLLELDLAVKTSQMPGDLALETLVASLTASA